MAYTVFRTAKLKGAGSIGGSIAHALREREVPNADPERTKDNEVLVPYDAEKTRNEIESARVRSDNVEMVELVMTTSPEWMDAATDEQKKEFEKRSIEFLEEKFGKENIRSLVWHKDEKTDHLSAHVTPIDKNGHLNAKEHLGGREKMSRLQDEFADKMKDLGLDRGLKGSKAHHVEIGKYYARVNEPPQERLTTQKIHLPEPERGWAGLGGESMEKYGERCKKAVLDVVVPKMKQLHEQVEALKKERDHLKTHTRWSRGQARTFEAMKVQNKTLEASYSTISRDNEKLKGRCQQQEKALTIVSRSKTIEPAIKMEMQKTLGQDRDRGRGR